MGLASCRPVQRRAQGPDLAEEIKAHPRLHADDHERAGLTPDEARRQAVLAFGGVQRVTEQYRERRTVPIVDTTLRDEQLGLSAPGLKSEGPFAGSDPFLNRTER